MENQEKYLQKALERVKSNNVEAKIDDTTPSRAAVGLERDSQYTEFLQQAIKNYTQSADANRQYKNVFFWVVITALGLIVLSGVVAIILISSRATASKVFSATALVVNLSTLLGAVGSIISAIIILPRIIAEYLFNKDEHQHIIDLIKGFQTHDETIHKQNLDSNGIE